MRAKFHLASMRVPNFVVYLFCRADHWLLSVLKKTKQADIVCSDADYMYFRVTFDNMCINNKNNLADLLILNK